MCQRTTCKTCSKPSWRGCGAHVEQVLGDVARADRCSCREMAAAAPKGEQSGFLSRIFSRG